MYQCINQSVSQSACSSAVARDVRVGLVVHVVTRSVCIVTGKESNNKLHATVEGTGLGLATN